MDVMGLASHIGRIKVQQDMIGAYPPTSEFWRYLHLNEEQEVSDSPEGGVSVLCIEGRVEQERPR